MNYDDIFANPEGEDTPERIGDTYGYKGKSVKGSHIDLDGDCVKGIMKALEIGMTLQRACELVGYSYPVVGSWLEKGNRALEDGKENGRDAEYAEFARRVRSAMGRFQSNNLEVLKEAGETRGQWQASAWLLERRCPDEYALKRDNTAERERVVIVSDVKKES